MYKKRKQRPVLNLYQDRLRYFYVSCLRFDEDVACIENVACIEDIACIEDVGDLRELEISIAHSLD